MMKSTALIGKNPNVVCTLLQNGDSVLLHLDTQSYYSLNPSGAFIWERIDGDSNASEIAHALEGRYDVSMEEAERSTFALISELANEQLVSLS